MSLSWLLLLLIVVTGGRKVGNIDNKETYIPFKPSWPGPSPNTDHKKTKQWLNKGNRSSTVRISNNSKLKQGLVKLPPGKPSFIQVFRPPRIIKAKSGPVSFPPAGWVRVKLPGRPPPKGNFTGPGHRKLQIPPNETATKQLQSRLEIPKSSVKAGHRQTSYRAPISRRGSSKSSISEHLTKKDQIRPEKSEPANTASSRSRPGRIWSVVSNSTKASNIEFYTGQLVTIAPSSSTPAPPQSSSGPNPRPLPSIPPASLITTYQLIKSHNSASTASVPTTTSTIKISTYLPKSTKPQPQASKRKLDLSKPNRSIILDSLDTLTAPKLPGSNQSAISSYTINPFTVSSKNPTALTNLTKPASTFTRSSDAIQPSTTATKPPTISTPRSSTPRFQEGPALPQSTPASLSVSTVSTIFPTESGASRTTPRQRTASSIVHHGGARGTVGQSIRTTAPAAAPLKQSRLSLEKTQRGTDTVTQKVTKVSKDSTRNVPTKYAGRAASSSVGVQPSYEEMLHIPIALPTPPSVQDSSGVRWGEPGTWARGMEGQVRPWEDQAPGAPFEDAAVLNPQELLPSSLHTPRSPIMEDGSSSLLLDEALQDLSPYELLPSAPRRSRSPPAPPSSKGFPLETVMGTVVGVLTIFIVVLGLLLFILMRRKPSKKNHAKRKTRTTKTLGSPPLSPYLSRPLPPAPSSSCSISLKEIQMSNAAFFPSSEEPDVVVVSSLVIVPQAYPPSTEELYGNSSFLPPVLDPDVVVSSLTSCLPVPHLPSGPPPPRPPREMLYINYPKEVSKDTTRPTIPPLPAIPAPPQPLHPFTTWPSTPAPSHPNSSILAPSRSASTHCVSSVLSRPVSVASYCHQTSAPATSRAHPLTPAPAPPTPLSQGQSCPSVPAPTHPLSPAPTRASHAHSLSTSSVQPGRDESAPEASSPNLCPLSPPTRRPPPPPTSYNPLLVTSNPSTLPPEEPATGRVCDRIQRYEMIDGAKQSASGNTKEVEEPNYCQVQPTKKEGRLVIEERVNRTKAKHEVILEKRLKKIHDNDTATLEKKHKKKRAGSFRDVLKGSFKKKFKDETTKERGSEGGAGGMSEKGVKPQNIQEEDVGEESKNKNKTGFYHNELTSGDKIDDIWLIPDIETEIYGEPVWDSASLHNELD